MVWQRLYIMTTSALLLIQLDFLSRKLFYYQYEVRELQKQISELKEKNTQLVYNLLPDHVAVEFTGHRKNHNVGLSTRDKVSHPHLDCLVNVYEI